MYTLKDRLASLVHRSHIIYGETLKLNTYQNYLSLIKDFYLYCAVFQCKTCTKLWYGRKHYLSHCKACTAGVCKLYPGGIYKATPTIFQNWMKLMFLFPKKIVFTLFFACYNFESFFDCNNLPKNSEMLPFEAHHVLLSVAIASNIPSHEEAVCFVSNGDSETLVQDMLWRIEAISESADEILKKKFSYVYDALKNHLNCRSKNLLKQFDQHNKELIILGFSSGQYDLNLIKPLIVKQLLNKIDFVIKRANTYLCLKTETLRFLDVNNYLALGYSYKKILVSHPL